MKQKTQSEVTVNESRPRKLRVEDFDKMYALIDEAGHTFEGEFSTRSEAIKWAKGKGYELIDGILMDKTVNESKHTPGPWEIDNRGVIYGGLKTKGQPLGIHRIATVNQGGLGSPGGNPKDNGNLIAAAPDMLEALKQAKNALHYLTNQASKEVPLYKKPMAAIDKAIAKANNSK